MSPCVLSTSSSRSYRLICKGVLSRGEDGKRLSTINARQMSSSLIDTGKSRPGGSLARFIPNHAFPPTRIADAENQCVANGNGEESCH